MARMKYPGTKKARCAPEKKENFTMSRLIKQEQLGEKLKSSVKKPVCISLRKYREIFGDSDEEEEEFYGFRSEDLGLKAYRSFSVKDYLDGSERVSYRKDGARDRPSRHSSGNVPKTLTTESLQRKNNASEADNKPSAASTSQNVYAKQYRKRDSYERRFARPSKEFDKACLSPNVKSTTQVRANFVPRVQKPSMGEGIKRHISPNTHNINFHLKKKAVPLAKQLVAKAKEGQRIRKQRKFDEVNKEGQPLRSRSGRVVKSKKLDYDDVTSPKFKISGDERSTTGSSNYVNRVAQKRRLEDGEVPPNKAFRTAKVKLEKVELPGDQRVYVNNPDSPTGFEIQTLSSADLQGSRFGFTDVPSQGSLPNNAPQHSSYSRKVRIKNSARMKNVKNAKIHYQPAKFPNQGIQRVKTIRTSDLSQTLKLQRPTKGQSSNKETCGKRSERIKIKKQNDELFSVKSVEEEMEDQASNGSSHSEVSSTHSDVSSRKTPGLAHKHFFKSKRLQELQEKIESETKEDTFMNIAEETACRAVEIRRHSKEQNEVGVDSDAERKSRPRSRRPSQEESRSSADEGPASEKSVPAKKKQPYAKKTQLSRLQALREDGELPSSSDDEESSKPLSQVKKELKKEQREENQERVVKKVIKVVRKIRTKSGETKTKVVRIIKKIGVRKKERDTNIPLVPGRRRIRCGQCVGCKVLDDCGVCRWCIDKPKFGGPGTSKQSCVKRKCVDPQPPKPKGVPYRRLVKDSNTTVKKRAPLKNDTALKVKGSKKGQNQTSSSTAKKPVASVKPPPCGKRQAVMADIPLVKLPWSDNSTEEEIWKEGFAVCFTAGIPSVVKELCFLCGSKGSEKMFYCRVCSEPFHGFCLDEEPIDETTWCCDNCSSCSVCGYQDKLLMCDRCQRGYHVECLGPFYPTEPEGDDDVWVCGRCVQCKNCGRRTAGDNPEAMWMLEFTHCQECGKQRQQNNFCPLCDKCYSDDDFESKMVHCVKCDHWVHAECQGITVDQYECLTDLPEEVQFICRRCYEDQVSSPWYKELMEEMEAGYERIVEEIKSCKAYEPFKSHFEQLEADNGYPKDFEVISAKVKDKKYTSVESFCDDITKVLDRVYRLVETDSVLTRQWSSLYYTFCKELVAMFPWHKLKSTVNSEEHEEIAQPRLKNGIIGTAIPYEVWDHSYVSLKSNQEKSDSTLVGKSQPSSSEALQMNSSQNENCEVEKMEPDTENDLQEENVTNEEPMEIDTNDDEQQQLKQFLQLKQHQQPQQATDVEDTRKCLLCGSMRDAEPSKAGRLLTSGLDEWVHVNCGLWSAEVFEDDEGRLQNVQVAISRGKQMKCEHCGEVGATVGCCEPRCPMNYHFMCARNAKAEFQDDKKVYCAQHSFRTKKELVMVNDDFCVERRVCVDMGKIRATKKLSRGFEPHNITLVQGSLTLEDMGKLSEHSDTKQTLYPINFRISRLYWSVKDPTKRCRYYCTTKEKTLESMQRRQQEIKESIDQEHLHKVISHEELNKKDKTPKITSGSHGDIKNSAQPRQNNKTTDYLNSSYGKKLKRIAPHPGPGIVNHSVFPGVLFNETTHLSKLRRILPAPQKPLPSSPTNSPRKLLEHLNRQTSHLPSILNPVRVEKSPSPVLPSAPAQKAAPQRCRKTPPAAKRTMSFEESIPQTVRQINCDHEVVAKAGDEELLNSPIKEISPKSWLVKLRERENAAQSEQPHVSFEITSDEGVKVEANTCETAWKQVFEKVQEARIDRRMKLVPFAGVNGKAMFGVRQESVVSMLEQLPGAHQLKQYSFKYNPPFDNSNLEETQALKENPHGCARAEMFHRNKKYDMFAFLASSHRVAPQLEESAEEQESAEQARDGPLSVKRPTCLDLPMAMRYRHLKQCSFNKDAVAVYRSPIHGRGLFCTRNIAAGEMVIEYSGMLVRSVLTDKREKYYESKGIGCYMFRVDGTYVVDATMCGNAARFINHSCDSNCFSRVITVDGQKKIIIFASRSISRGEELTYDYKFPIEDEKLPCLCHSKHCRKYLN